MKNDHVLPMHSEVERPAGILRGDLDAPAAGTIGCARSLFAIHTDSHGFARIGHSPNRNLFPPLQHRAVAEKRRKADIGEGSRNARESETDGNETRLTEEEASAVGIGQ